MSYVKYHILMDTNKIPVDIIISSFRGNLSSTQNESLHEWLSEEDNTEKYEALKKVWDQTVSDAGEFESPKGYRKFRRRTTSVWKTIAATASMVAIVALVLVSAYLSYSEASVPGTQEYTCLSGKSLVILPDGSSVTLHKGATLSYSESFSCTNRVVSLDGEAYFDVTSDPENTFTVSIDEIGITVYGTSFNVMEDNKSIVVSLLEGSLDVVSNKNNVCSLVPGHAAVYDKMTGCLVEGKADVAFASCWAKDRLTFTQASLGEVCRYMSKWYGIEIILPESLESSCLYTFTIREESVDQILGIMDRINPMNYIYTNDNRIIISEIL